MSDADENELDASWLAAAKAEVAGWDPARKARAARDLAERSAPRPPPPPDEDLAAMDEAAREKEIERLMAEILRRRPELKQRARDADTLELAEGKITLRELRDRNEPFAGLAREGRLVLRLDLARAYS